MRRPQRKSQRQIELEVENWNLKHKIGTPVTVRRDDGSVMATLTRSEAQMLSGHTPVVWVEGIAGAYLLDRVEAI